MPTVCRWVREHIKALHNTKVIVMNEMVRPPVMGANASVRSRYAEKTYLLTKEAAEYLTETTGVPLSATTLDCWRTRPPQGGGPRFCKFGRRIVYARTELDRWQEERRSAAFSSTSEMGR